MSRRSPGFIFLESVTAMVIISVTIVAVAPIFMLAQKADTVSEQTLVGAGLASELLEEVRLRKWDENVPNARPWYPAYSRSVVGTDAGEDSADKSTFDDVDDFHNWAETPPRNPLNVQLTGLNGYRRTVTVKYVTSALAVSGSSTDYKLVTVCAEKPNVTRTCLDWLSTNQ